MNEIVMNEALIKETLVMALVGVALGLFFFGGLWWTVVRGLNSTQPVLWFLGGGVLRMSIVLSGFYLVSSAQWQRLMACLVGFLLARLCVIWLTRTSVGHQNGAHASAEFKLTRVETVTQQDNSHAS